MQKETATVERVVNAIKLFPEKHQVLILFGNPILPGIPVTVSLPKTEGIPQSIEEMPEILFMDKEPDRKRAIAFRMPHLLEQKTVTDVFHMLNKPDRLQLLSILSNVYEFDKQEYSELLHFAWTSTEFPHQMKVSELVSMFNRADPKHLMNGSYKAFEELPDEITVYRGWSETNVKAGMTKRMGLAWTTDRKIAEWFAKRWKHTDAKLAIGKVRKSDVYMYTNERNEREVVINPRKVKNKKVINV